MTFEDIRISRAFPNAIYVKECTKRGHRLLMKYNSAYNTELYELYNRPSYYKERAYNRIIEEKRKVNGYRIRVFCANSMAFSMAFTFMEDGFEKVVYYTKDNIYIIA